MMIGNIVGFPLRLFCLEENHFYFCLSNKSLMSVNDTLHTAEAKKNIFFYTNEISFLKKKSQQNLRILLILC